MTSHLSSPTYIIYHDEVKPLLSFQDHLGYPVLVTLWYLQEGIHNIFLRFHQTHYVHVIMLLLPKPWLNKTSLENLCIPTCPLLTMLRFLIVVGNQGSRSHSTRTNSFICTSSTMSCFKFFSYLKSLTSIFFSDDWIRIPSFVID